MPIIARAIKKLRHDKKKTTVNALVRKNLRTVVKKVRVTKSQKDLALAYTTLDKAAKIHVIHKNKADRLKSRLAKITGK